jgi:hypothetical protein
MAVCSFLYNVIEMDEPVKVKGFKPTLLLLVDYLETGMLKQ